MKRKLLLTVFLLFVFTLSSCKKEDDVQVTSGEGRQVADNSDENFKIILYSDKDSYSDTEEVDIWATIEYIGSEDNIVIYSGEPYAGFDVESEGIEYISFIRHFLLKTTTLKQGVVYEFPLRKSGGFSADAEDSDYWREFYSEERMLFPVGEYNLTFSTDFYTDESSYLEFSVQYQFDVF